jgi:hypothetical protein
MRALWAARRGLGQAELLDYLGSEDEPMPPAHWAPLRLAAGDGLLNRSGLLAFGHDYLRLAVEARYLPGEADRKAAHAALADYFGGQERGERQVDELPWQLSQAAEWRRLYDLLADLAFFAAAWEADQEEVLARWAEVETHSDVRKVDAYRAVLDAPEQHADFVRKLASLLQDSGGLSGASRLRQHLVERYRRSGDQENLSAALGNQAVILRDQGDPDGAMELHREQERICRELGLAEGLTIPLGGSVSSLRRSSVVSRTRLLTAHAAVPTSAFHGGGPCRGAPCHQPIEATYRRPRCERSHVKATSRRTNGSRHASGRRRRTRRTHRSL